MSGPCNLDELMPHLRRSANHNLGSGRVRSRDRRAFIPQDLPLQGGNFLLPFQEFVLGEFRLRFLVWFIRESCG
jgi:hypothetical protein